MLRLFLTGIGGFIGNHLAKELVGAGYKVGGLLLPEETMKSLKMFQNELTLYRGDILQASDLKASLIEFQPEIIFHLAAFAPVNQSLRNPAIIQRINYEGTVLVAEVAKELDSLRLFGFPSSSEVYGSQPRQTPFCEKTRLRPSNPYAVSKLASEMYLLMLKRTTSFPAVIMRFCNTYGRRTGSYVLEYFIKQALAEKPLNVMNPSSSRDLIYIDDHVAAYCAALKTLKTGIYNIGTGQPISIRKLAERIVSLLGSSSEIVIGQIPESMKRQSDYISLDSTKAEHELKWRFNTPLDKGILQTARKIDIKG